jgi:hypothetical protein
MYSFDYLFGPSITTAVLYKSYLSMSVNSVLEEKKSSNSKVDCSEYIWVWRDECR